jgi:tetratricopeptide (TPR) repeat protein
LNPALNQVAYYHIERGQALYFLRPDQQSDDSHAYHAFIYRQQRDYLDAYQELLAVWHSQHTSSWVVSEMSITLERLAEYSRPSNMLPGTPPVARLDNDESALPWLQLLTQVDPNNVYGQYVVGRVQYDLHNFTMSITQMSIVIRLSPDANIQSSAYTYMALSDVGQGDYVNARQLLFKAVELDPNYHNNTAREELSGLR